MFTSHLTHPHENLLVPPKIKRKREFDRFDFLFVAQFAGFSFQKWGMIHIFSSKFWGVNVFGFS
jgi:hypothetical protein